MLEVDFFFGLGSRYSYLAFSQISRIEVACSCRFKLHPLGSQDLLKLRGVSPFVGRPLSGQYEWEYRRRDAAAWADYYGVPYCEPKALPKDHRLMSKACYAAGFQGALRQYCEAMFRSVFVEAEDIDERVCGDTASRMGLNREAFESDMLGSAVSKRCAASARLAYAKGAFGVPTFFVADNMFWGNDRLVLLEHYLARSEAGQHRA